MSESPRRVDLRLTIPARSPYRELAVELTVKFAEYVGAPKADVHAVVESALAATNSDNVEIDMVSDGRELVLTTNLSSRRSTFPVSD